MARAGFAPEVRNMYASAIRLSARFTRDMSDFWDIDARTVFAEEKVQ